MGLYIRKVLENKNRRVLYRYNLQGARFAKYSFSNLHILHFRCFILIITVPSCIYEKHFKESIRDKLCIVAILRRARFAKYRFSNLHSLDFRCFIPCLGSKSSLYRVVLTKSVKSVRESAEITYIYSQSSKSSFRKIAKISVTSPIVINIPTRELLAGETKSSFV